MVNPAHLKDFISYDEAGHRVLYPKGNLNKIRSQIITIVNRRKKCFLSLGKTQNKVLKMKLVLVPES